MPDPLEALAEKGRRGLAAVDDARSREQRDLAAGLARGQLRVAQRSTSPIGWMWPDRWGVYRLGIGVVVTAPWLGGHLDWLPYFALGYGTVALLILAGWLTSKAGYQRERRWAQSLPFSLVGYFETLGDTSHRVSGTFTSGQGSGVRISLDLQQRPDASVRLEEIVAGFDPQLKVKDEGRSLIELREQEQAAAHSALAAQQEQALPNTARAQKWKDHQLANKEAKLHEIEERLEGLRHGSETLSLIRSDFLYAEANSRTLLLYLHRMVDRLLLPLHEKCPIRSVALSGDLTND